MTPYSVALCSYNGEKYIQQQIDSILNQTHKPSEIIICDDGSTDRTHEILINYQKKFPDLFKIYFNKINLKSVKNFEKAISLCSKEIIFLSDQDDLWTENKAEKIILFFENHPKINCVATNGFCIDEKGNIHEKYSLWDVPIFLKEKGKNVNYFELISFVGNIATGASMAFRASIKPNIIPFPIIKNYHHDEWIAVITAKDKSFELLEDKLFYYRNHEEQQVGGVFFNKNEKMKKMLINRFDISLDNHSFLFYKRLLKRLSSSYEKTKLLEKYNISYSKIHKEKFLSTKEILRKHYPIRSRILFFIDKFTGKRQLKE